MVALVVGGVLLALHPSVHYYLPSLSNPSPEAFVIEICPARSTASWAAQRLRSTLRLPTLQAAPAACSAATNGREHALEALGLGAVILVGLSFLPRRRPVVTIPVNPSVL
jgi:hypothetical protein